MINKLFLQRKQNGSFWQGQFSTYKYLNPGFFSPSLTFFGCWERLKESKFILVQFWFWQCLSQKKKRRNGLTIADQVSNSASGRVIKTNSFTTFACWSWSEVVSYESVPKFVKPMHAKLHELLIGDFNDGTRRWKIALLALAWRLPESWRHNSSQVSLPVSAETAQNYQ